MPIGLLGLPPEIHDRIFQVLRRSCIKEDEIRYNEDGLGILPTYGKLVRMVAF